MSMAAPEGFELHDRKSPLTEPWEPIYRKIEDGRLTLGVSLDVPHTNSRGFAHGGFISALADNAMGLNCLRELAPGLSLVTANLSLAFHGSARIGQWITFEPELTKTGGKLCFAELAVRADGSLCAKAHATFAVISQQPDIPRK